MDALAFATWALALCTFGLAVVAGWTALQTRDAAQASRKEAEAATRTIEEMRRDRDLSWQPYLITGHATVAAQRTTTVINIGRGPAVNCLYANRFRGAWAKKGVFGLGPSQEEVMWTPEAAAPPIPAALFEYKGLELDNVDQVEAIFCQDVVQDKVFRFIVGRPGYDVWRTGDLPPQWGQALVQLEPHLQPRRTAGVV
jgi:hypothetical protein